MEILDREACYRVFQTHDARFDGRIFVGVTSTGIYCRPICPARTPKFENCRYFASAAAAQEAGFRPCLRCRPETAPELAFWRGSSNTVSRAMELIAEGALDESEAGVEALAERLGVGGRQLRRLFQQHLGASPIAVAQTRRVLFAKHLIHDTRLPMTEVALSAGFGSVRRFNEIFRKMFGRPPSALRRAKKGKRGGAPAHAAGDAVTLRLSYRPPYDWPGMLDALRYAPTSDTNGSRTACGIAVSSSTARQASVAVAHLPERNAVAVTIEFPDVKALPAIVARVKRVFDLGADIATIGSHLARDPKLAPLIAKRPGLRAPATGTARRRVPRSIPMRRRHGGRGTPTPHSISGWPTMAEPLDFLIDRIATPIGELIIIADREGRLRTIDWTDHEARMTLLLDRYYGKGGYTLTPKRDPGGLSSAMRRYFKGDIAVLAAAGRHHRHAVPEQRLAGAAQDRGWHHDLLRRARPAHRQAQGGARGGPGQRAKPDQHRGALPPGDRLERQPDRLRRRTRAQAVASRA